MITYPLRKIERDVEECKVLDIPVELIWTTDEYHEYGGDFTYGWKADIDGNQYGDFVGLNAPQRQEAKQVLLDQCAQTIEALRRKNAGES